MFKNYFKPTSKKIEKLLLALKGFVGTIAVTTFVSGDPKIAFYFLIGGAAIDFLLRCNSDDSTDKTQTPQS